jgi:hypothetical protein
MKCHFTLITILLIFKDDVIKLLHSFIYKIIFDLCEKNETDIYSKLERILKIKILPLSFSEDNTIMFKKKDNKICTKIKIIDNKTLFLSKT